MIEAITVTHLGIGHVYGVENDAVKTLHRQLVALFLFKLPRHQPIGLENFQIVVFTETSGDLKFGRFAEMVGQVVVGRQKPEAARFLENEFFLNQFLDQVSFKI